MALLAASTIWGLRAYNNRTKRMVNEETVKREATLRREIVGVWIEKTPSPQRAIPLSGVAQLDIRADGSYAETAYLAPLTATAPVPIQNMSWHVAGTWEIRSKRLCLRPNSASGPTSRPLREERYFPICFGDELMLMTAEQKKEDITATRVLKRVVAAHR